MFRNLRKWRILAVLSTASIGLSTATAIPASASTLETFQNEATSQCLATVDTLSLEPGEDPPPCGKYGTIDWWRVTDLNNGYVLLESDREPGQCICDSGGSDGNGGTYVFLRSCDANYLPNDWLPVTIAGGYVILRNRSTGYNLDDSLAYHLRDFPGNDLPYQNWY